MTRTKKPRKTSSIKKELGRGVLSHSIVANKNNSQRNQPEDLNKFLSRIYESTDHLAKEFERLYEKKFQTHHDRYEYACKLAKKVFEETAQSFPEAYLNSMISKHLDEDLLKVEKKDVNGAIQKTRPSRICKPDNTFNEICEFKRPKTPKLVRSSTRQRSNSALPPVSTPSSDRFKTPNNTLQSLGPMPVITPKVASTPMCFLRRPERGEVAFAASGSPLLVRRVSLDDIPTVSIPLQDGRIFSILPDPGACAPSLPEFDEETKKYLKTLQKNLELLIPNSP